MLFNSFQFLWLFPLIFVAYWGIVCRKHRHNLYSTSGNAFLLAVSYGLYIGWNPMSAIFLFGVTAVTYLSALLIEKKQAYGRKKYLITTGVCLAFLPLFIFKYYNFLNDTLTSALATIGIHTGLPGLNWAVPLGISFFTFQAVGYLWDVYYQRAKAEHDWWDYMLFVSFFPQIASGPISKARDLMPQIKSARTFDYGQAVQGCKWLLWGMFLKVVMADRAGMAVDSILPNYMYLSGPTCALGAVLYSLQIYGDFAGYSFMAVGTGKLLGFELVNNFNRPYFAASVTEFWKRWHISLTRWLTDYVYIPLGGNRCSKARTYSNVMATFLVSGIWHGANWTFIVWGLMHGLLQVVEKALGLQKCTSRIRPFRIIITFILVTAAWVFFRMPTLEDGWGVICKICTDFEPVTFKATKTQILFTAFFSAVCLIKEYVEEYLPSFSLMENKHQAVRWTTYVALLCSILLCGVLDAGSFIYVSF